MDGRCCKEKLGMVLLSCMLLTGCGREEEIPQESASENTVQSEADIAKESDADIRETDESGEIEGMTKISVLGKTELILGDSRIYGGNNTSGILTDCFTSEETDLVLDTVWGSGRLTAMQALSLMTVISGAEEERPVIQSRRDGKNMKKLWKRRKRIFLIFLSE